MVQLAPVFWKFLGAQLLAEVGDTIVEGIIDTSTDIAVDKLNDAIQKVFPSSTDPNSFTNMFMQNVKMQTTVKAQARMMSFSMANQQKLIGRIDEYKEKVKNEKQAHYDKLNGLGKLALMKGKKKADEKEKQAYDNVVGRINTSINGQINASNQVGAFTQGLGTTKMAYDQANNTDLQMLNANLIKLLNGMGYYETKLNGGTV